MGQIFNRIKNITKSYINDKDKEQIPVVNIDDYESDLERQINEAARQSGSANANNKESRNTSAGTSAKMDISLAYKILGVSQNATVEEIKAAYKTLIKQYHPDKIEDMGDEIKSVARKKTQEINSAYNFLKENRNF